MRPASSEQPDQGSGESPSDFLLPAIPTAFQVLEAMGQKPTEEELFQMISEVDDNMSGSIDFAEFLKVHTAKAALGLMVRSCRGAF